MTLMSDWFAYAIQSMVFEPPSKPGYREHQAGYVYTSSGLRIARMLLRPMPAEVRRAPVENLIDLGADVLDGTLGANGQRETLLPARPLLLYSHGNAEDLGTAYDHLQWLATSLECDVLAYDYVGYGHSSDGLMSEANMYLAAEAVYEHAARRSRRLRSTRRWCSWAARWAARRARAWPARSASGSARRARASSRGS